MKSRLTSLCNHRFHAIAQQFSGRWFIDFDVIQRNVTKRTFPPIAAVRHGQFIPPSVAPHAVHRVDNFDHRNVFIQQQVAVIGCSKVTLFVI